MKLKELMEIIDIPPEFQEIEFSGLANNSKQISPGDLFIAIKGGKTDGFLYLKEAIERGACAAIVEKDVNGPPEFPVFPVENVRKIQGLAASLFYGQPSRKLRVIGVTGTNGKTTVTHLISHLLSFTGKPVGLIGTIWTDNGHEKIPSSHTTPDSIKLQQLLAEMVANRIDTVVMEVSSHALCQERVSGVEFDVAVLTNITHDHFDFHQNYQNYFEAKNLLFKGLQPIGNKGGKYAVLNADDLSSIRIAENCQVPVFFYGLIHEPEISQIGRQSPDIILFADVQGKKCSLKTQLPGRFNIYNILAAVVVANQEGLSTEIIERAIPQFPGVPGRYQKVDCGQPFKVMVDFAHNPDALNNISMMARESTTGKVILVFGCEGEKDRLKRPLMGKIAVQNAEIPILTSDNLYHEEFSQIFGDIIKDLSKSERDHLIIEPDRKQAIQKAIELAKPDDFVIIAGKGHEQYLVTGTGKIEFNDVEIVKEIFSLH